MGFLVRELLDAGLLDPDVKTVAGDGLGHYAQEPFLDGDMLRWRASPETSLASDVLRPASDPFDPEGGLRLLKGSLGRAIIKVSSVPADRHVIEAPAAVFDDQDDVLSAFKAGGLDRDVVVVVRFQGPAANGMPELHKLTPALTALQNKGFRVALVTDGRMSGASGAVPAAIHLTPEAAQGGSIGRIVDGDMLRVDALNGVLEVIADPVAVSARALAARPADRPGWGRELFSSFRAGVGAAESGASIFFRSHS